MNTFSRLILEWHKDIDRQMPWKNTKDPYKIWVSEIILQQTRVKQGIGYYLRFIEAFSNIKSLATAPQTDVLKIWEGLGYYSRARNLQIAAKDILNRFGGVFPKEYNDILSLKGIGPYTASAISSFAFGGVYPVIDGNVIRVLSRYFGITEPVDRSKGKKVINRIAIESIDTNFPAPYNQAIMDFGALVCMPKRPSCADCVMSKSCIALKKNIVNQLPNKPKKTIVKDRFMYYFICFNNDKILVRQRKNKGIWEGLYEFPGIESPKKLTQKEIISAGIEKKTGLVLQSIQKCGYLEQKLTHLNLYITFFRANIFSNNNFDNNIRLEKMSKLSTFAFPKPLKTFIASTLLKK
ncbi:MAG: A/G-specific adenine glycosylase [Saprospiraceae bacterium]